RLLLRRGLLLRRLLGGRLLLRRGLLLGRLLGGCLPLLLRRTPSTTVGEQLGGPIDGDLLDRVALAQRRVDLAVGDVGAEAAVLHHDRTTGVGVVAELAQRRGRLRATSPLRLGQEAQALVERDGEQLLLGLE